MAFNQLIAMKKSSKNPKEGDIFVVQPIKDVYYYGKVIQTNVESEDSFISGMTLIYIYKRNSNNKIKPRTMADEEFLIAPIIVNNQPWKKGYFETIGNETVFEKEKNIDIVFWDVIREEFVDINGNLTEVRPQMWNIYGLGSYGVVGKEIQKAIGLL